MTNTQRRELTALNAALARLERATEDFARALRRRGEVLSFWAAGEQPRLGGPPNAGWFAPEQVAEDSGGGSASNPSVETPYVAKDYRRFTQPVGDGNCVPLVEAATGAPAPATTRWREGAKLVDRPAIPEGTAIATFVDGRYPNWQHGNHAAIFVAYGSQPGRGDGIYVYDQYVNRDKRIKAPGISFIPFHPTKGGLSSNGSAFSVIR